MVCLVILVSGLSVIGSSWCMPCNTCGCGVPFNTCVCSVNYSSGGVPCNTFFLVYQLKVVVVVCLVIHVGVVDLSYYRPYPLFSR